MYTGLKEYDRDNSHAISRKPCFTCDSSDANVEYDDGHHFCYSCETYFPPNYKSEGNMIQQQNSYQLNKNKSFNFAAIADRKISEKTCREYGVTVSMQGSMITDHRYEYYDKDNNHIATKFRQTQDKKFYSEGNMSGAVLFGQNKFNQGGKYITVCEGELDAMSAYELLGSKWPVVSIKNGAASALKNCQQALDYLNKFDQIVLCFDNDKQGREAEQKVADYEVYLRLVSYLNQINVRS